MNARTRARSIFRFGIIPCHSELAKLKYFQTFDFLENRDFKRNDATFPLSVTFARKNHPLLSCAVETGHLVYTREEKRSAPLCPISLSGVIIAESADPVDLWADIHLTLTAAGIINWWKLKLYPI